MDTNEIIAAYVGASQVSAIYIGSDLVWPSGYSYTIVTNTLSVHYSSGDIIYASGSNFAYFTADVRVMRGQSVIQTITNAVLTPSFSSSAYFYVSGTEIHAYSRGTTTGLERALAVSVSYGGIEPIPGGTVFQEANSIEEYSYNLAISLDVSGTIPSSGGVYDVDYIAQRMPIYTSLAHGNWQSRTATVTGVNCTPSPSTVTGVESLSVEVGENTSTTTTRSVYLTISCDGETATSLVVTQDVYVAPVVPTAAVFPEAQSDGSVVLKLVMTQGEYPGGLVAISGIVYHYTLNGSAEQTVEVSIKSVGRDGGTDPLPNSIHYFAGDYGEHWFTATRVGQIGIDNTTFPHTQFNIMETLTD